MARGFLVGSGGGGGSSKQLIIYDSGSWNVGYDNPGTYINTTASGYSATSASPQPSKVILPVTNNGYVVAVIGTAQKLDLSRFTTLHILCKGLAIQNNYGDIYLSSSKVGTYESRLQDATNVVSNVEHEIAIDVTNLTEAYLSLQANGYKSFEFYKIWLT